MIKTTLSLMALSLVSTLALASDPLHGSKWKTIDDETKKPLSIVQFIDLRIKKATLFSRFFQQSNF